MSQIATFYTFCSQGEWLYGVVEAKKMANKFGDSKAFKYLCRQ